MTAPKVFISYSHDSPAHKGWVIELARFLVNNGVEVIIDTWGVRPGEDLPKFMEDGVTSANRVLMICTERYVEKADGAIGGVGYEKMIVTAELVKNLGTAKFIPVIRQSAPDRRVPKFMGARYYIDLSDGLDNNAAREHLLRDLHNVPPERPPLGPSPFAAVTAGSNTAASSTAATSAPLSDPMALYQYATMIARNGDIFAWRNLVSMSRDQLPAGLAPWWKKHATALPSTGNLVQESMEGVAIFAPLIAVALAGIASTAPRFKDQAGVLEDILHPPDWQRSGYVARTELPMSAAFVFQALHGALCLYIEDLTTAFKLARTPTQSPLVREAVPLWARHDIIMWPHALGQDATQAWKLISTLPEQWSWVATVFGNLRDYQTAVLAYYIALNTLEFFEYLAAGHQVPDDPSKLRCDIPPVFETMPDEIKRGAYRTLAKTGGDLGTLAAELRLDRDRIRSQWPKWVNVQKRSLNELYPFARIELTQESLIPDVFGR
jgi:TIR domain